jgi:hypothetical protein
MTEPTTDAAVANLNARVDLLSSQLLQIAQMQGTAAERTQTNQREVITYVTQKIEELTNVVAELQGAHTNGQVDDPGLADRVRSSGRGHRDVQE